MKAREYNCLVADIPDIPVLTPMTMLRHPPFFEVRPSLERPLSDFGAQSIPSIDRRLEVQPGIDSAHSTVAFRLFEILENQRHVTLHGDPRKRVCRHCVIEHRRLPAFTKLVLHPLLEEYEDGRADRRRSRRVLRVRHRPHNRLPLRHRDLPDRLTDSSPAANRLAMVQILEDCLGARQVMTFLLTPCHDRCIVHGEQLA